MMTWKKIRWFWFDMWVLVEVGWLSQPSIVDPSILSYKSVHYQMNVTFHFNKFSLTISSEMVKCISPKRLELREECVGSVYRQPKALALTLAADCSLSQTPLCQRCNSILEEALTAAMKSTSDESSLEVVN